MVSDRPIHDTIGSLVVHGVFDRHPTLRVASIENGSDWVALLVKRLKKQANQTPWVFPENPLDTIRQHVWVTPYYEEDMRKLADLIGVERVLFGSDWPHGEGLAEPSDFVKELHAFSDDEVRIVMRDNCLDLLGPGAADVTEHGGADRRRCRVCSSTCRAWLERALGPGPDRRRVVGTRRCRRMVCAALPARVGRARLLAALGRRGACAPSSDTARCSRRAVSGC